jgi:hypothetical protein
MAFNDKVDIEEQWRYSSTAEAHLPPKRSGDFLTRRSSI